MAGKVAVVTGGSRGIGAMIAGGLVRAGCRVYITARKAAACDATAAELSAFGECISVPLDLAAAAASTRWSGPLASARTGCTSWSTTPAPPGARRWRNTRWTAFDKLWNVNIKALFALTVQSLPLLRAAASADDPARVINIGSIDGLGVPALESYAYSTTKAGVHMLTRHLASTLAAESITVNAIAPGPFDSKMMAFALDDPQTRAAIAGSVPLGRIGEPDDMAGAAIFLASRAGRYLTGAVIPVDGGLSTIRR